MDRFPQHESAVPSWARRVGTAVWVVGPDRTIRYMNRRAEIMLGASAPKVVGRPCHHVIAARDATNHPFCRDRCPIVELLENGRTPEPVVLRVDHPRRPDRWIRVLIIRVDASSSGPSLVHFALDSDRSQPIGEFIARVASRTPEALRRSFRRHRSRSSAPEDEDTRRTKKPRRTAAHRSR